MGADFTNSMAASNAWRRLPNGSRGHLAEIGFSIVGFSAPSSGAATSLTNKPPNPLAAAAIIVKISLGATDCVPSRHHDVVQSRCDLARVIAT